MTTSLPIIGLIKKHVLRKTPLQAKANCASILYSVSESENVDGLFRYFLKKVKKMSKSLLMVAKMRFFFPLFVPLN